MASIFVLNTNTIDRKLSLLWFNYFMGLIIALTTLSREYNSIIKLWYASCFWLAPPHLCDKVASGTATREINIWRSCVTVTCHVSRVTWYKVMLGSEVLRSCTLKMLFRGKIFTRKQFTQKECLGLSSAGASWRTARSGRSCRPGSRPRSRGTRRRWRRWPGTARCWARRRSRPRTWSPRTRTRTRRRGPRWGTPRPGWSRSHWSRGAAAPCCRIFFGLSWTPTFSIKKKQLFWDLLTFYKRFC